ncbi:MAG: hypothetical protein GTO41_23045 [Burkholderiales bacterium]|nr:hypothetical protein [Burkholderiales bacterium]
MEQEGRSLSVINVNVLGERGEFGEGESVSYEEETTESRLARRSHRWTPARVEIAA